MKPAFHSLALAVALFSVCSTSFADDSFLPTPRAPAEKAGGEIKPMPRLVAEVASVAHPSLKPTFIEIDGQLESAYRSDYAEAALYLRVAGKNEAVTTRELSAALEQIAASAKSFDDSIRITRRPELVNFKHPKTRKQVSEGAIFFKGTDPQNLQKLIAKSLELAKSSKVDASATPVSLRSSDAAMAHAEHELLKKMITIIQLRANTLGESLDSDARIARITTRELALPSRDAAALQYRAVIELTRKRRTMK